MHEIPYWYRPFGPPSADEIAAQILAFLIGTAGPADKRAGLPRRVVARAARLDAGREWRFQIVARGEANISARAHVSVHRFSRATIR